jgi:uncharacterized protein (TIGR00255 family)
MIYSMTGFASGSRDFGRGVLSLELRTVNSRFLDLHFRIADELRFAEPGLRELLTERLGRGKVDCRIGFASATTGVARKLNHDTLATVAALDAEVRARLPGAAPMAVADVLRWPGIFGEELPDPSKLQAAVLELAGAAIDELAASRSREGAKLGQTILDRIARIREIVVEVAPRVPAAQAAHAEKLRQRLVEAIGSADDERIRQEVVLFAQKADVAEELSRLSTHADEVERVLSRGGAVGKRLDFLMQELNREANTLGSKAVVKEMSQAAMELKLLIEQMREQIQNLE